MSNSQGQGPGAPEVVLLDELQRPGRAAGTRAPPGTSQSGMPLAKRLLRLCVWGAALAYALGSAASALGAVYWAAELLTHFRVQAAVAGALLVGAALALRAWAAAGLAGAIAACHLLPLLPYLVPAGRPPEAAGPRVRLLQVNVHTANPDHAAVARLVAEKQPDVLALFEVSRAWLEDLSALQPRYPQRIARPRNDNFGIALWSRFPIDGLQLRRLGRDELSMIEGRFVLGSTPITLAVAHPVPPAGPRYSALRNQQLAELAAVVREAGTREVVLLGDLNTSPWSPYHRRLEEASGLRNAARGLGLFPTWPTSLAPLMIPLDHCLLSAGLRAVSIETGPAVGSDHLPVLVEIEAPPAPADARERGVERTAGSARRPSLKESLRSRVP